MAEKELRQAVVMHEGEDKSWLYKDAVSFDPSKKSPENRKYLILMYFSNPDADIETTFSIAEGRTEAYFAIKNMIEEIDLSKSVVYLEGNPLVFEDLPGQKKIVSALAFLRHVLDDELVQDDTSYIVDEVLSEMEGED